LRSFEPASSINEKGNYIFVDSGTGKYTTTLRLPLSFEPASSINEKLKLLEVMDVLTSLATFRPSFEPGVLGLF
jgi:hypothetical protein